MVSLKPWEALLNLSALQPRVITLTDGKAVLTEGLFSHRKLCQLVWVKDDGSPTKYGQRPLSFGERAMLWDIPIIFMACFGDSQEDLGE